MDLLAIQQPQERDEKHLVLVSELVERFDELVWAKHLQLTGNQVDSVCQIESYDQDKHQPLLLRLTWRQVEAQVQTPADIDTS
jgi:hypothetical protein